MLSLYLASILLLTTSTESLDITDSFTPLPITENTNGAVWPLNVPNFSDSSSGVNYTLEKFGDTDTWTKFFIEGNELKQNYTFDFEDSNKRTEDFTIKATKSGETAVSTQIRLQIKDVNDHTPVITNLPYTITVSEAIGVNATVYTITGKDDDGTNEFNFITFFIIDGNPDDKFYLSYVNQKSASVKIRSRLDYDTGPEVYNLTINATDARATVNPIGLWTVSYFVIKITDVDDLAASFTKEVYGPINIAEDLASGSFIAQVTAVDKDKTVKDEVLYSLVQETNPGGMFTINGTTGNITLLGRLDRETKSFYALLVRANSTYHDPVHAQVLILLDDANVHKPNFTSETYAGEVAENAEPGTLVLVVQATDSDQGSNAEVSYTLAGEHDNKFLITTVDSLGYIYVNSSLDYDVKNYYNFSVIATESLTSEKYNDTATVVINVTEILSNENNPKFSQAIYEANVTEGMLPERVVQVNAVDSDQGQYGSVTYSIVHDVYGMFTIDNKSGWINTTNLLNREDRDSYTLVVRASDGDTRARHTDVLVVVTVLDINDNTPTFLANSYSGFVVENSNVGNTILAVEAKDLDAGANAAFNFTVFGGNEKFSVISDGTRGYVIVNGSLDYEVDKEFTFVVIAEETATSETNKANVTVTVSLIDVNDNSPVFSSVSGYSVSLAEDSPNGTSVFNVSAADQDSGTFGQIVYTLYTSSVPFTINPTTGEITTAANLDREIKSSYSLTIKAQDGGKPSLFSYAQVFVNITDTNDNPPTFSPSSYAAEIEENMKIGSSILTVTATDADEGPNSYLRYYIQDSNGLFDVVGDGVVVVNGSLDYESNITFTFVIFAEEGSTAEKWKANCTVTIRLKDVNEFDPEFPLSSYYGYIKENSASDSLVVTVQANDQDGVLNVITYEIVSGNEKGNFSIDQHSGAIKTTGPIDRETTEQFILKIRASDNGTPNRTAETFVVIEVLDANDHSPVFTQSNYSSSVPESLPVGTTILTVKAIDLDVNSTNSDIRYFISGSDSKFDVTTSGHVFVNGTLDFESKTTYSFMIFAEETGTVAKQQHNASIVISVTDVNEYDPVFTQSGFYGNVSENAANGTAVLKITASDQDGYYKVIKYSIIHGNDDNKFSINGSSGVVFTAGSLDRETKSEYILTVKAEDNGNPSRTSEVTVVINILDVSDNGPIFNQPTYNATIFENIEPGTTVLTVKAEDQDEGENAQFDYYIMGGGGHFEVLSDGVIVTKATLDYETSTSHTFLVIANETNSSGNKKANTTVTVFVQDVNEFNPVFGQLRYAVNVSENSAVGTPLVQVNASDKDGFYNKLTYSIVSGNDDSKFTINASTGLISTNATLDRETVAQFILNVRSDDNGISPARTAETIVIVNVVDLSDHSPVFLQDHYNVSVFENLAVGTTVLTVEATDNDKGANALIQYSIVGGDGAFRVTENGDVIVNASLDYEVEKKYEFQVIAKESQAASGFNDSTNVTIFVQDVNEYNPVFNQLSYSATVNGTLQQGTPVIQVTATDADGLYKIITYSIVYGSDTGVFEINSTTGWIATKTALQSETRNQYILTVKAEDNGVSPRTAEVLVVININKTNENATFLVQYIYNVTVLENALVGSTVVKLDVRDSSKDETSVFSFNIGGGNGDFEVSSLGEVQVKRTLDYEIKSLYSFKVTVTEIQPASGLAANATINVKVLDVNEFNPKFSQDHYVGNVSEGAGVGTFIVQVSASDSDGFYNISTYTIIHGNEQNNFTINATSGEIKTATPLDREVKDQFILTVRAQDNGPSGRTGEVVVIVDILDISDHPPLFLMSNYSGMIFENAPVGSTVLTVKTSDLDMDTKSSLTYAVVGGDGKFGVTSDGAIYVNGSLDYETKILYTFLVTAEEPIPFSHHKDNVSVSVKLMDVNEFNPEFNQSIYSASVNENDVIGTSVVTVFASDKDGDFNLVTYSIVSGNSHGNFSINNSTGTITMAKLLDRELHHQVILTVRGEDNGIPPRTSEVTVIIGITDSNDNGPVFQMPYYNASISEEAATGTIVIVVLALDQDSTQNSLAYHIDSEDSFKMETRYGLGFVVVNKELDYEMKKSYSFMVYAIEETIEKRNTSVQVNITVLDANDNRPVFENSSYTGTVMEGIAIATPVLTVSVSDADSEAFLPVYFEIVEGDPLGNFTINNMTGLLETATVLDREIQQSFHLIIEARDSGSPALTETVAVTISVVDHNDASPRFVGSPYTADVQENSPADTNVLTIQALDMDKSKNGEFTFSLVGDGGLFSITQDGNIGHIKVAALLDYEKNQTFQFYVVAKETGSSEKLESNASVVVTLIDVNDNSPVFQKPLYKESVGESPSFPISVGTVSAVDKDSGAFGNITFFIIHGDENGNFTINNKSGLVETAATLNRESQDRYVLTIEARDGGSPPRTAVTIMVIKVTDQNEQPPIFHDTPYEATVVENKVYSDSVVLKVSASDPDKMEIKYTLQPNSSFSIEQTTGVIEVTGSFDRELQSVYNLTVTAIDKGGLNASEQVLIRVTDTNDNSPQFLNTPYETSIPDNTTIGTSIMTVTATDADEAHNSEIIFSLLGAGGRFAINQNTGEITVVEKLDSQGKSRYELQVLATDRGIPQARVNSTSVVVNLTDYSNGPPKFESVAYVGEINETLTNEIFVLNVKAIDHDDGILGQITYSITGGNTHNAFRINSTGAILSTIALDYENDTQKTFDLTVTAADRDGLKDTTQVRVTVLDVNDNAPTIVNIPSPAEVNISDQVPAGTLLYVLQAQDLDSEENGEFEFFGNAVPDNLTVDQTTGIIKAKTVLQNSASASISLTVFVSDKGSPRKSSSNYTILFNIATNPSSTPFLLPSLTEVTVYENASIGDVISVINSSLPADNFSIIFQLPNGGHFKIDNDGSLSLAQKLDRETVNGYSLLVEAVKGGTQALGYVSITVGDVNDKYPEFLFNVYKGQIDENVAAGSAVLAVEAVDEDQGNTVSYFITSGNSEGVFNISADGEIRIAKPPDYEKEEFYNLTVVASDGANNGTAFVEVTIVDVNDNSPSFLNSSYSSTVPEDTPGGTSILKVSSVDDDGDIIIYSISGTDGKFTIDSISGVITTTAERLDYENQTTYSLNVTATDTGGLQTSVMVVLNIMDTNDNEPIFEKSSYNVTIAEGHLGLLPVSVKATDEDSGLNGNVTYSFKSSSSLFSIDPVTGTINSTVAIDRDGVGVSSDASCRGVFVLFIQAEDRASPPLTDSTTVTVYVTDVNDNKPMFSKSPYEVTISVADTGDVLLVKASDSDCGVNAAIQYSYTSDNGSSLFEVNATTGNVTIKKSLNGSEGVYFLNVSATNEQSSPKLQSSVMVKITVIENKNYAPAFEKSEYNFNVSEGADIGFTLGSVSAADVNQGKNGVFIYSIQNPGYAIPFDIDPETGSISLVRELNREERMNYTLIVVAKDFGDPSLSHTTTVVITVDDVNDEVPKFAKNSLSVSTPENLTVGSYVASVYAVDGDVEKHGEPIYVIHSGNEEGYFRIDNSTGFIYLMKELDRELINVFELVVRAYNYGSNVSRRKRDAEPVFSQITVIINITDINDNYPEFAQTNYVAGFKDSSEPGTKVATVLAIDKDEGLNSQIVYKIASGNEDGAFEIDPNTGLITTTAAVSQLTEPFISLTVAAQDSSPNGQQKTAQKSATVKIYKLDSNPLFVNISSSTDRETIINLLKNITGPDSDIIIESISKNGLLSIVKYYVVKNGDFLTQSQMANLIIKFCEENEDVCKKFGINLAEQNVGSTNALLGEDDISILEAMLLTLGVIVGVGGLLGILLLCCLRRRKRYMPVFEPSSFIIPSKAVSFDEKPRYFNPDPQSQELQEVEIHIDEEETSVDSTDEVPGSTTSNDSNEIENSEAIAKVHAYMNHALMNDDSDSDSSEDTDPGTHLQTRIDGDSLRGSTEPLVQNYDITSI